jgi:hypothetical protein
LRLIHGTLERLTGRPLVPVNDDELPFEVSLEIVGEKHCRHPRPAMNEEHYRLLSIDTPDKEVLDVSVDIELEQVANCTLSKDWHGERLERVRSCQQQEQPACDEWPNPFLTHNIHLTGLAVRKSPIRVFSLSIHVNRMNSPENQPARDRL